MHMNQSSTIDFTKRTRSLLYIVKQSGVGSINQNRVKYGHHSITNTKVHNWTLVSKIVRL